MFTWLNDLSRWVFNKQLTSVEVCDCELEAAQSLNQADTMNHVKIAAITAEILLRYKTHICCLGWLHQIAWISVDFIHYPSYSIIKNSFVINRSCLFWGTSCSFSCSTRTISPGSMPGAWSASPVNVIFCPCLMPLSTWTSRTLVSLQTLWPSHFLQRSFSFITSPGQQPHTQNRGPQRAVLLRFVH